MQEIIKAIEHIERDLAALKKKILEQTPSEPPKSDPLESEYKRTAIHIMEILNAEYNTKFLTDVKSNITPIVARLKQGYKLDDFILVIKDRKKKWGEDPKMCEYLRPSTLFTPTNFGNYLNCARREQMNKREKSYSEVDVEAEILRRMAI